MVCPPVRGDNPIVDYLPYRWINHCITILNHPLLCMKYFVLKLAISGKGDIMIICFYFLFYVLIFLLSFLCAYRFVTVPKVAVDRVLVCISNINNDKECCC